MHTECDRGEAVAGGRPIWRVRKSVLSAFRFFILFSGLVFFTVCSHGGFFDSLKKATEGLSSGNGGPVEITLFSDKENTRFRVKLDGEADFHDVGTGKIITIKVPADKPLVVSAEPPDYIYKEYAMPGPIKQVQFFFLVGERVLHLKSDLEDTSYRLRRQGDSEWQDLNLKGKDVKYLVPRDGRFEIEASSPGCYSIIHSIDDPAGVLNFNKFQPVKGMEVESDQDNTRFLIRNTGRGDENWEYLGFGRSMEIKAPVSGQFEISARPFDYQEQIKTLTAPVNKVVFTFSEANRQTVVPPPPKSQFRGSLAPRTPELAGVLADDKIQELKSREVWRAVLIGISDYGAAKAGYPNLETPRKDVEELGDLLKQDYGFKSVTLILDREATLDNIRKGLFALDTTCSAQDNVLIYYAGHGALASNKAGRWVCADGIDFANAEIEDFVRRLKARRVLLVSDSCFSGEFVTRDTGVRFGPLPDMQTNAVATSERIVATWQPGRQVLTSGPETPVLDQGQGFCQGHSPFACQFINDLRHVSVGAVISATDLYAAIADSYRQAHVPEDDLPMRGSLEGDAGGEFYFLRFK